MPAERPSGNPFRNPRMIHAARDGMLIRVRCGKCGRAANYWAADLVEVVGPDHELHIPPFRCSRCRTAEWMYVSREVPDASAVASLVVRRPVRKVTRWIWREETGARSEQ